MPDSSIPGIPPDDRPFRERIGGQSSIRLSAPGTPSDASLDLLQMQRERDEARDRLAATQAQRERLNRVQATLTRELNAKDREIQGVAAERDRHAELLIAGDAERIALRHDRDKLTAQMAEVRRIAYQGGQSAVSVRSQLLAYLEVNGGING